MVGPGSGSFPPVSGFLFPPFLSPLETMRFWISLCPVPGQHLPRPGTDLAKDAAGIPKKGHLRKRMGARVRARPVLQPRLQADPTHHCFSSLLPGLFCLWYFGVEGQHKH